jgi:hypothetical protein
MVITRKESEMTKEEIAKQLDGSEYPLHISKELRHDCLKNGIVIVYGASDDLMEFRGAIEEELDCYGGGEFLFDRQGQIKDWYDIRDDIGEDDAKEYFERKANAAKIEAIWSQGGYSWQYKVGFPCVGFDVMEDGEKYCRGIVFNLTDI